LAGIVEIASVLLFVVGAKAGAAVFDRTVTGAKSLFHSLRGFERYGLISSAMPNADDFGQFLAH
jgi:hypothetical protein